MDIIGLSNMNILLDAFQKSKQDSIWKESVQKYESNLLVNLAQLQRELREGTYKQRPFYEFVLNERGKIRYIKSLHIRDRIVQRAICDYVLTPLINQHIIYDNGASVKFKGISFTRKRLQCHLEKYIRRYGSNGYILLIDFSKFFDNIPHDKCCQMLTSLINDEKIRDIIITLIESFKIDVSNYTNEELIQFNNTPFNMLDYNYSSDGIKYLNRSIGIGSQISQLIGIYYPTPIDNFCKIEKHQKYYGRYMDDIYIISNSKEELQKLLNDINKIANNLGLFINLKKTKIFSLMHGFTFLQIKYRVTKSGHIVKSLKNSTFVRERRKLKKYKKMLNNDILSKEVIQNAYKSWRGNAKHFHNYKQIHKMDKLYISLFGKF